MYLYYHSNAADTLEGITRWWLTRQRYEVATSVVKKALDKLITRGLVAESTRADALIGDSWHGVFTYYFCEEMRKCQNQASLKDFLQKVREDLAEGLYSYTSARK